MGISISFNVGDKGKSKGSLSATDKHNERKFKSENLENTNSNINFKLKNQNEIIVGTKDLFKDIKKIYQTEFKEAVDEYNKKQKRKDRKVYDYFEKISSDGKTNLYTEVVVQIGDNEFWKEKNLDEKKQMVEVFKKQIEVINQEYPNYKIANAIAHFDETSPHLHIVGICVSNREIALKNKDDKKDKKRQNGLSKYVSQSEIFTQNNLKEFHEKFSEKSVQIFNEIYKTNEVLNDKKLHQKHLELSEFKKVAPKIKEYQKEYDMIKKEIQELKKELNQTKEEFNLMKKDIQNFEKIKTEIELEKLPMGRYTVFDSDEKVVCYKDINENRNLERLVTFYDNSLINESIYFEKDFVEKTKFNYEGELLYQKNFSKEEFFEKEKEIDEKIENYTDKIKELDMKVEDIEKDNPWETKLENENPWAEKMEKDDFGLGE